MTQRELAELARVGPRLVSELERGKPTLRVDAVNRVLQVFGKQLGVVDATRRDGPPSIAELADAPRGGGDQP